MLAPLAACGGGSSSTPGVPPGPSFVTYQLAENIIPSGPITVGSDGALWLIGIIARNETQSSLWRVSTSGAATLEYSGEFSGNEPFGACTTGSDGNVWFGIAGAGIGRITPSGTLKSFPLPTNAIVAAMTVGPDGAVWFTDVGTQALGRITTAGVVTEYPTPLVSNSYFGIPNGIALGSDGALWFTSYTATPNAEDDLIGRYSPATGFTSYPLPSGSGPTGIAAGPDGALWFTESLSRIGRIATSGVISQHKLPAGYTGSAQGITRGPDNALWFAYRGVATTLTQTAVDDVGEITTAGIITLTPDPVVNYLEGSIAATSDGSLWLGSGTGLVRFTR